jgi:hypothetical protein
MELYLVKSSGEDEWGNEYWENLQIFNDAELAGKFAEKIERLIKQDGNEDTEKVEIENFTLRTEAI